VPAGTPRRVRLDRVALGKISMTPSRYRELRAAVIEAGYEHDIEWAQTIKAPPTPVDFAGEVIWVIHKL